jgi:hypothetical protein
MSRAHLETTQYFTECQELSTISLKCKLGTVFITFPLILLCLENENKLENCKQHFDVRFFLPPLNNLILM